MHVVSNNFTHCFFELISQVYQNYDFESAPRGMKIRECLGASFEIKNPRNRLPFIKARKFSLPYVFAECMWYFTGNNSTEWIAEYSKFWKNISDDGQTANSAYGHRIFTTNNSNSNCWYTNQLVSQWEYIKRELRQDRDSRRAVVHIRLPSDSQYSLDVPCTLTLQYFIRDNKLYAITSMRSSDIIFGLSYDVPAFTMFQEVLAHELGVGLGTYKHMSNSLHVYERHFKMCEDIIQERKTALCDIEKFNTISHRAMPKMSSPPPVQYLDVMQRLVVCVIS